jgi:hypothetical protein
MHAKKILFPEFCVIQEAGFVNKKNLILLETGFSNSKLPWLLTGPD